VKPGYIFTAVLAVCIILAIFLPQLGSTNLAASPDAPAPLTSAADQQAAPLPIETAVPITPDIKNLVTTLAKNSAVDLPPDADDGLREFVSSVRSSDSGKIVGVYVPGLFGMPVTTQPDNDDNFISTDDNVLTQYARPARFGVIAMLAHNYLNSGRSLLKLRPSQGILIVYGDGKIVRYKITSVQYFEALDPHDVRSEFRDLNGPGGAIIGYDQLFEKIYTQSDHLVFQTCLEANGELSWGRVFISAEKEG
jgi:hypothetical protein